MMDRNTLILLHFVAYTLGLIATFVSLFLMNSAQPALLYLVPFTLIPVFVVSIIRGDFAAMWQGDYDVIIQLVVHFKVGTSVPAFSHHFRQLKWK